MNSKSIIATLVVSCIIFLYAEQMDAQTNDQMNSLNSFSFDLYNEVIKEKDNENIFLSPLSTYYALLMAYEGSENETKQEFEKVLYVKNSDFTINGTLHTFADEMESFNINNAIWLDRDFNVKEKYRKSITSKYFSDFMRTDFRNVDLTVSDINAWVSDKTNQRINEIINSSNINTDTKVLISNAIYFNEEWHNKFDKQKTTSDNFYANTNEQYSEVFMNITEKLQYFENGFYQFISKSYKDSDLSFCIILPKDLFGLDEVEKKINGDSLKRILENTHSTSISLTIPKFKLELNYELSNALKNLGLKTAFSNKSDFSGITEERPLTLDKIIHKTMIELDEEKTVAAAATATGIFIRGIPSYKIFKADHPFMFFVINNRKNEIIFLGRYMKPIGRKAIEIDYLTDNLKARKKERYSVGDTSQRILYVINKKKIHER